MFLLLLLASLPFWVALPSAGAQWGCGTENVSPAHNFVAVVVAVTGAQAVAVAMAMAVARGRAHGCGCGCG